MAVGRTFSAVVVGVRARIVEVEANLSAGLPGLSIVGRPDPSVNEARDRVRAAVLNSGLKWPEHKITVGLSPASLPKRGSGLDVAIALAILAADRQIPADSVQRSVAIGELGLDGRIRPVAGALASALAARQTLPPSRFSGQVISGYDDGRQLRWVPDLDVLSAANLAVLVARLRGEQEPEHEDEEHWLTAADSESGAEAAPLDLCDVAGQDHAKFALEIAAAGGHHLALLGRAGVGKTLLAERLPGLLPDLSDEQALDVTSIHQLSGRTGAGLIRRPPWAAPHHTASRAAMVGGGSDDRPSIGMASLAHRGVLFVDELGAGKCTS